MHPRRGEGLTLAAIHYACFDPERGEYVARTAGPWTIQVSGAESRTERVDASPYPAGEIPDRLKPVSISTSAFTKTRWRLDYFLMACLLLLPPLFHVLIVLLGRKQDARAPEQRAARRALRRLQQLGSQPPTEYVHSLLFDYFQARFSFPPGETTPADVERILTAAGLTEPLVGSARNLVATVDAQRFGEASPDLPPLALRVSALILQLEAARTCS